MHRLEKKRRFILIRLANICRCNPIWKKGRLPATKEIKHVIEKADSERERFWIAAVTARARTKGTKQFWIQTMRRQYFNKSERYLIRGTAMISACQICIIASAVHASRGQRRIGERGGSAGLSDGAPHHGTQERDFFYYYTVLHSVSIKSSRTRKRYCSQNHSSHAGSSIWDPPSAQILCAAQNRARVPPKAEWTKSFWSCLH